MKVVAAINHSTMLVEMSAGELSTITKWRGGSEYGAIQMQTIGAGEKFDIAKEFREARDLLQSFRGIAPALRQSAERLRRLASEVEIHEPDASLLAPKGGAE